MSDGAEATASGEDETGSSTSPVQDEAPVADDGDVPSSAPDGGEQPGDCGEDCPAECDPTAPSRQDGACDAPDDCTVDDSCDTDEDGWTDELEMACGTDGESADSVPDDEDDDGVCDEIDLCEGDDQHGDSDGDGLCDGFECVVVDDFEDYAIGALSQHDDAGPAPACGWTGGWSNTVGTAAILEPPRIDGLKGIALNSSEDVVVQRSFNGPASASEIYLSVRAMDLCRVVNEEEPLGDMYGDCRLFGKLMRWELCAGDPEGDCLEMALYTQDGKLRFIDPAGNSAFVDAVYPRPLLEAYPSGMDVTMRVGGGSADLWLGHHIRSGPPTASPTLQVPAVDLAGHDLGDFDVLVVAKTSLWGEGGAVTDDVQVVIR